jgi:glycosyltransferase involved in cell wall biosynthesis
MSKKIILIGNYLPDKQNSMLIFESLMADGYTKSKHTVSVIRPSKIFSKFSFNKLSLFKWFGYIDKFLLFPMQLLIFRFQNFIQFNPVHYHICDHSNAFYLYFLPKNNTIITCHDVLAVRAGLGYTDTYCSATKSGQVLQKIILKALSGAKKLAAVSEFTLKQLRDIDTKPSLQKKWICIHNALSDKFVPMQKDEIKVVLGNYKPILSKPFILHVGSDLERKNRKLLLEMVRELQKEWDGLLVLAGEPLNLDLLDLIEKLKLNERILQINNPKDIEIIGMYSLCEAMVFPSFSEGFGWPIIEAQACGAPVITSNKAPMMNEVGGNAALYANPNDAISFADQFRKLNNEGFRKEVICDGYENTKRFDFENTIRQYIELLNL